MLINNGDNPIYRAITEHMTAEWLKEFPNDDPPSYEESSIVGYYQFCGSDYVLWGDPEAWVSSGITVYRLQSINEDAPHIVEIGSHSTDDDLLPAFKIAQDDAFAENEKWCAKPPVPWGEGPHDNV